MVGKGSVDGDALSVSFDERSSWGPSDTQRLTVPVRGNRECPLERGKDFGRREDRRGSRGVVEVKPERR